MADFEFTPLSDEAKELTEKILRGQLYSKLTRKLLCACLGPNNEDDTFKYREECYKLLKEHNHIPYYPESVDDVFISRIFDKDQNWKEKKEILLTDLDLRNKFLVSKSDIVFILITSYGPILEFGRYAEIIPTKIVVLVPENIPSKTQSMMAVDSFQGLFPNSVIKFKDVEDMRKKIEKCLYLEARKRIWEEMHDGK